MVTSALSLLIALVLFFGFLTAVALLIKVMRVNREELREVRRIQGSPKNILKGKLANSPNEFGDFRIVRGLKWSVAEKRYISQSALSTEGLRAAFSK